MNWPLYILKFIKLFFNTFFFAFVKFQKLMYLKFNLIDLIEGMIIGHIMRFTESRYFNNDDLGWLYVSFCHVLLKHTLLML